MTTDDETKARAAKLQRFADRLKEIDGRIALATALRQRVRLQYLASAAKAYRPLRPLARMVSAAVDAGLSDQARQAADRLVAEADVQGIRLPGDALGRTEQVDVPASPAEAVTGDRET